MHLIDLKTCSFSEKIKLLREMGNYLATRTFEDYYIRLYTIKNLYIEIWSSSHLPWQDIAKVKVFDDFQQLEPYLPTPFFDEHRWSL